MIITDLIKAAKQASILKQESFILALEIDQQDFYPEERQPLIKHLLAMFKDKHLDLPSNWEEQRKYILLQSLYHYFEEVSSLETQIINPAIAGIVNNNYSIWFDNYFRIMASLVLIDEGYHVNCALNAINQMEIITNVSKLPMNPITPVHKIIHMVKLSLPDKMQADFELMATCLIESTLTKDLDLYIQEQKSTSINPFFYKILASHFLDEARHSYFAFLVLQYFWKKLNNAAQVVLRSAIMQFIESYVVYIRVGDLEFVEKILMQFNYPENYLVYLKQRLQNQQQSQAETLHKSLIAILQKAEVIKG